MNGNTNSGVAVLVHELTHALGFTDDMFDKFIDAEGQPIPQSKVGIQCGYSTGSTCTVPVAWQERSHLLLVAVAPTAYALQEQAVCTHCVLVSPAGAAAAASCRLCKRTLMRMAARLR
jgi:hypothetical protein